jgi:hypothetical protein
VASKIGETRQVMPDGFTDLAPEKHGKSILSVDATMYLFPNLAHRSIA